MWRRKSMREKVDIARGHWLVKPEGDMLNYIHKKTGVPREEIWDYILGRKV